MAPLLCIRFILFLAVFCLLGAPISAAAVPSKSLTPYIEGLDALNEGRWSDAVSAFSRALDESGDDPDIHSIQGTDRIE